MSEVGQRVISVIGVGSASAPADIATVNIGVSLMAASVSAATSEAATRTTEVITAIKSSGVAAADIQTADYSVFAEQDHRGGQPMLRGYRVNNSLRVVVRDLDNISELLEAATRAGGDATTVHGISFAVNNDEPLRIAARNAAWHDAVQTATQLAQLAELTLGPALAITEGHGGSAAPQPRMLRAAMAEAAPPIESGETAVAVTLTVDFEATCE